ncbi:hypothetical protein RCL1_002735 [Eukaryota sp. TZLM3-RCL]
MRLTVDLIRASPQFWNPLQQREISLRGHRIPSIENLAATLDQFRVIDLTDNVIRSLDGFPTLNMLETLLLTNNKIVTISPSIGSHLPNLRTLILTNNQISSFDTITSLQTLPKLEELSLLNNPITTLEKYREKIIELLPSLKVLDFSKIKSTERMTVVRG